MDRSNPDVEARQTSDLLAEANDVPVNAAIIDVGPLDAPSRRDSDLAAPWADRFPSAEILEQRVVEGRPHSLRQSLLRVAGQRPEFVLWEERVRTDEAGSWVALSSGAAYAGDALLMEAPESVLAAGEAALEEIGIHIGRRARLSDLARVELRDPDLKRMDRALQQLGERFPGALIEREALYFTQEVIPSDWKPDYEWGLDQIGALDAWTFNQGSPEVVIAVIDSGIQRNHPDFASNLFVNPREVAGNGVDDDGNGLADDVTGWDFFDDTSNPNDATGHGTHVAGIAGARGNNGVGTIGVNWSTKILPLKVGGGSTFSTLDIVEALDYVIALKKAGANIVVTNNSYGSEAFNASLRNAIRRQQEAGILFVAAAGNDGTNMDTTTLRYPAGYPEDIIIAVANSNQEDRLTESSERGAVSVDLAAPGEEIYSTDINGRYSFKAGTSMASPFVAGAAALLASAEPDLTWREKKIRILDTADRIPGMAGLTLTGGRLNLMAMLRPELAEHRLELVDLPDGIVISKDPFFPLRFKLDALPEAQLAAELVEGGLRGELWSDGPSSYVLRAFDEGVFRIRFIASLEGVDRMVERAIVVGEVGDVTAGLLHRFDFGGSGSTEPDLAGTANGTYASAAKVDTEFGRAAQFSSVSSNMSFPASFSNRVTFAALVRSDDLVSSQHPRIFNTPYYLFYFSSGQSNAFPDGNRETLKFFSERSVAGGVWNTPPRSIRNDEWYYIVATYDSRSAANRPSLYINGMQQVTRLQGAPSGTQVTTGGSSYLASNGSAATADQRSFRGMIGAARMYDRELGPGEIAALGAALVNRKWDRYALAASASPKVGQTLDFVLSDADGLAAEGEHQWLIEGGESYELMAQTGNQLSIRFLDRKLYRVAARVSDGMSIRYFTAEVDLSVPALSSGLVEGNTETGGVVWVEVDPGLASGSITIFDAARDFYRLREPIVIDETGNFYSTENSLARARGSLAGGLSGAVEGFGIVFEGASATAPAEIHPFAGWYRGGVIARAGELLDLLVSDSGEAFLWREGPLLDIGKGSVGADGAIDVATALGAVVSGQIGSSGRGSGFVEENVPDRAPFFLMREDLASSSVLVANAVAGRAESGGGFFASVISRDLAMNPSFTAGFLLNGSQNFGAGPGNLLVLDRRGRRLAEIDAATHVLSGLSALIASRGAVTDDMAAAAILLQGRVSADDRLYTVFSVVGPEPKEILLRALGPGFAPGQLVDPRLLLHRLVGDQLELVAYNGSWTDGTRFGSDGESPQGLAKGLLLAFETLDRAPLDPARLDSAMRIWLSPGVYFADVSARGEDAGPALLDIAELP